MLYRAILSKDPKVGSYAEQRALFSEGIEDRIVEFEQDEMDLLFYGGGLREGDVLLLAHARVLGRAPKRERYLDLCVSLGVWVKLPGEVPVMYDAPEKKAAFHQAAIQPTGRPSAKQKRLRGRPRKYPVPSPEKKAVLFGWWHNTLPSGKRMPLKDVLKLATDLCGHKVSRDYMKNLCGKTRGKTEDV